MSLKVNSTVNVFIVRDNKVLLGRRINTGWMDGYLCPPGGHVENGETPTMGLIREIEEELGVKVKSADVDFLCVAQRNNTPDEIVAFEFVIKDKDYDFKNAEPEKCSELVWVDPNNLPDDVIEDFASIIKESYLGDSTYLELGY